MSYNNNPDVFLRINDQDSKYLKDIEEKNRQNAYTSDPFYIENIFEKTVIDVQLPIYEHEDDSGMDIREYIDNSIQIETRNIIAIPTGLKIKQLPKNTEIQIRPRSGLAFKGITVVNSPGTIDEGYRGEIKILLINVGLTDYIINSGDRIAQLVLAPVLKVKMKLDHQFKIRNENGFGSTGVK